MIRKLREIIFVYMKRTKLKVQNMSYFKQTHLILHHQTNTHSLSVSHSALSYGKLFSGQMENKYLLLSLKHIETSSPTYTSLVRQRHVVFPSSYICSNHDVSLSLSLSLSLSIQCEKEIFIYRPFQNQPCLCLF